VDCATAAFAERKKSTRRGGGLRRIAYHKQYQSRPRGQGKNIQKQHGKETLAGP